MATLYSSDFESATTDAVPEGWLGPFLVRAGNSAITVSGTKAMAAYGEVNQTVEKFIGISARTQVAYQIKQKAQINAGAVLLHGLGHSSNSANLELQSGYRVIAPVASATSVQLTLDKCVASNFTNGLQTNSRSWSVASGDIIVQKLVIDGTSVKYWVWNETNESQPATPIIDYTDSPQLPAGYFFLTYNNGGGAVATGFDDVLITDEVSGGGGGTDATAPGGEGISTGSGSGGEATGGGSATGSFTFSACRNNTLSGVLNNVAVSWTWLGGTAGAITSITNGSGTMTTAGMTISGLPVGVGCGIFRTLDGTVVGYEEGTVT